MSKFFGLAVGEGVCDLRLPSASRIPDISYYGVDLVLYPWSRFFFACDFQSYSYYWLVPLYPTFNSFAHCSSVTLHRPHSPSDCLSFFILVFFLYSTPGQAQIRSFGVCRGSCRPAKIVYWSPVTRIKIRRQKMQPGHDSVNRCSQIYMYIYHTERLPLEHASI